MKSLRLVCTTAFVVSVAACSLPMIGGGHPAARPTMDDVATDIAAAPPVIQVREFWRSSVVDVVAWDTDNADFGLRASVSRTGTLVGGRKFGDHRLFMTPLFAYGNGGFKYAAVTTGRPLLGTGAQRDPYSCFYGKDCSPMVTVGVGVPDSLLRANRDSLVVTFLPRVDEPWTIKLRRELITAYLTKVDSVVAELRKTASM